MRESIPAFSLVSPQSITRQRTPGTASGRACSPTERPSPCALRTTRVSAHPARDRHEHTPRADGSPQPSVDDRQPAATQPSAQLLTPSWSNPAAFATGSTSSSSPGTQTAPPPDRRSDNCSGAEPNRPIPRRRLLVLHHARAHRKHCSGPRSGRRARAWWRTRIAGAGWGSSVQDRNRYRIGDRAAERFAYRGKTMTWSEWQKRLDLVGWCQ